MPMHVEEGQWTVDHSIFGRPPAMFRVRAIMPAHRQIPECVTDWCSDNFGEDGWTYHYACEKCPSESGAKFRMIVFFKAHEDAMTFYLRWA